MDQHFCLAPEPIGDPLHRFMHLGGGARVTEAQEMSAVDRIEINARRGGDARLVQHAFREIEAVVRKS